MASDPAELLQKPEDRGTRCARCGKSLPPPWNTMRLTDMIVCDPCIEEMKQPRKQLPDAQPVPPIPAPQQAAARVERAPVEPLDRALFRSALVQEMTTPGNLFRVGDPEVAHIGLTPFHATSCPWTDFANDRPIQREPWNIQDRALGQLPDWD
jgi:hypothetical protein